MNALKAHIRCLENMPRECIRTIPARVPEKTPLCQRGGFLVKGRTLRLNGLILKLKSQGKSVAQISDEIGVSKQTISKHLHRNVEKSEPRTRDDTRRLHKRILALKKKGLRNFEIAPLCKVSRQTVGKHLLGKIRST